jgi:FkbM family methyltransferase
MALPTTALWRDSAGKRLLVWLSYPVFLLLNRPAMRWFAHAAYDFALRCNGIAINFPGRQGLTIGEERFLASRLRGAGEGVLLDVGANHGAYTAYMHLLCPAARIFAFEPHPRTFQSLRQRVGHLPGVRAVNLAVSAAPGQVTLFDFAAADGSTQASLDEGAVKLFGGETIAHAVCATTIDAFMADEGIREIDLLKIDTEGFDLAVLRGARGALARGAIKTIQFEFIPADIAMHVTMRDFFEVLAGYRLFRVCLNGALLPLGAYDVKRCEIYVTQTLVALRP